MTRSVRHVLLGVLCIALMPVLWVALAIALVAVLIWETLRRLGEGFDHTFTRRMRVR